MDVCWRWAVVFGVCSLAACRQAPRTADAPPAATGSATPTYAPTTRFEDELREDGEAIVSAQETYAFANGGYFDSNMSCLVAPAQCIPDYDGDGSSLLDADRARLQPLHGYVRTLHTSPALDAAVTQEARVSPTSVENVAYTAVPETTGIRGVRALCLDLDWACYARDGVLPPIVGGRCPRRAVGDAYTCIGITSPASSLSELRQMRRERPRAGQTPATP